MTASSSNFHDNLGPRMVGRVKVYKRTATERVLHSEGPNLIVTSGRAIQVSALFPQSSDDYILYGKMGDGGSDDNVGTNLVVPTVDMTDLVSPRVQTPIARSSLSLGIPEVTLLTSMDNTEGNGYYISEVGFFSGAGNLFSIRTFTPILKDITFAIDIEWTFGF